MQHGLNLKKVKFCDINSWEMCLIYIQIDNKEQTLVIEKYQNHYGSIKWNSIFSKEEDLDKKLVIEKIREKYPLILINEEPYNEEFIQYIKNNPNDFNYYKKHYVQEVDKIVTNLKWLQLRKFLKIS